MVAIQWFGPGTPWLALRDGVLPELRRFARAEPGARFRFWCVGCGTGQEPYGVAMLVDQYCEQEGDGALEADAIEIVASDRSQSAVYLARAGRFSSSAMRQGFGPPWQRYRTRYIREEGGLGIVDPAIAARVRFIEADASAAAPQLGRFDLILWKQEGSAWSLSESLTPRGRLYIDGVEATPGALAAATAHAAAAAAP